MLPAWNSKDSDFTCFFKATVLQLNISGYHRHLCSLYGAIKRAHKHKIKLENLHHFSKIKIKKSKRSHNTVEIKAPDPDPGDPKTCGSARSGSATLLETWPFICPCDQMTSHSSTISLDTCSCAFLPRAAVFVPGQKAAFNRMLKILKLYFKGIVTGDGYLFRNLENS